MSNKNTKTLSSLTLLLYFFITLISQASSSSTTTTITRKDGGGVVVNMELWCVAKNNAEDATLQAAVDWACGQGGADCRPIQPGGTCYDSSDVQKMASYAFNDYYLKHGLADDACSFDNNAALTSLNPSRGDCKYPSSVSTQGKLYRIINSGNRASFG